MKLTIHMELDERQAQDLADFALAQAKPIPQHVAAVVDLVLPGAVTQVEIEP